MTMKLKPKIEQKHLGYGRYLYRATTVDPDFQEVLTTNWRYTKHDALQEYEDMIAEAVQEGYL